MLWACGSPSKLLTIQRAANSLTAPTRWKGWRDGYRGVVDAVANDNAEQLMMCLGYGMGPAQRKTVWLDTRVCELGMCEDANGGGKPAGEQLRTYRDLALKMESFLRMGSLLRFSSSLLPSL